MGHRRWQAGIGAPSRTHGSTPERSIAIRCSTKRSRKQEKSFWSWIFLGNGTLASTSSGGQPFKSEWIGTCLHAGSTGSSPGSGTINQARGRGEVPAEDRRGTPWVGGATSSPRDPAWRQVGSAHRRVLAVRPAGLVPATPHGDWGCGRVAEPTGCASCPNVSLRGLYFRCRKPCR